MSRDDLATEYLDQLPFEPYPSQEEALLAWFTAEEGVLFCAPTGTGKTLVAEAALFEALHTGKTAYYTTPLIALTEQKFQDMQEAAERWGFSADDVGLVTGNRRVNPQARVLVVVAEILLNRLLHPEAFDFDDVSAVVMDEFHSFNDPERGAVWELTLGQLPKHVRLMLLSATVGNAGEFLAWLKRAHNRHVKLVESSFRRVPLTYQWVGDELLNEHIAFMSEGDAETRLTPALLFCFNRETCWTVAEQLKGKHLLSEGQQKRLSDQLSQHNWNRGAGPKLKQLLQRGVGVHHAGLLPLYRRIVEDLFQKKLLSVCVCTETLAAGINLPARSVVLTSLMKGPPGKQKLIDPSSAHQMFGRAGRPQFDSQGYVFVMAHEDDVKIARWREKYDEIPEDTKDPGLRKAKKALKKKMPTRRSNVQYWNEAQFEKLKAAPPTNLASRGQLPWRLLAFLLHISPDIEPIRALVGRRFMEPKRLEKAAEQLDDMLLALHNGGFVTLQPEPPPPPDPDEKPAEEEKPKNTLNLFFGERLEQEKKKQKAPPPKPAYKAERAVPTEQLEKLLAFRSVNPLYGVFLTEQFDIADEHERLQALESVLEMPGTVARLVRVPRPDVMPPGPLAEQRLNEQLIKRGLLSSETLGPPEDEVEDDRPTWIPPVAEKLKMLFDHDHARVRDVRTTAVWAAGELLEFGGDFDNFVSSRNLAKQEGIIFRHVLRLILLCEEFAAVTPPGWADADWRNELRQLSDRLTAACRTVDPESTDKFIEQSHGADLLEAELADKPA